MEYMIMPLKRYFDFSGRSRRKEYWLWTLFLFICYMVLAFGLGGMAAIDDGEGLLAGAGGIALMLFVLAILIPSVAVQVRRFHDQDKSGWLVLIGLIPFLGGIIVLVFMCLEGTRGPNRYGPDPKDSGADARTFA